jgi:hypothetical protein
VERHHERGPEKMLGTDPGGYGEPVVDVHEVRLAESIRQLPDPLFEEVVEDQDPRVESWGRNFDRDPVYEEGAGLLVRFGAGEVERNDMNFVPEGGQKLGEAFYMASQPPDYPRRVFPGQHEDSQIVEESVNR